jgi:hypothetical protein
LLVSWYLFTPFTRFINSKIKLFEPVAQSTSKVYLKSDAFTSRPLPPEKQASSWNLTPDLRWNV